MGSEMCIRDRYEADPGSVDAEWRRFFDGLDDSRDAVVKNAEGASWKRPNWPVLANGELTATLDGNWGLAEAAIAGKIKARSEAKTPEAKSPAAKSPDAKPADAEPLAAQPSAISDEDLRRATRDSLRALMMIRAFRLRGHLHANLDPLGLEPEREKQEITPEAYGFTEADYDRPIFIDNVLGLETATVREMLDILRRTYCSTIGFEFMHVSDPDEKAWIQLRIEGPDKSISFTREGKRAILNKLVEAEGFEKFLDVRYTGTKRFGLDGGESMVCLLYTSPSPRDGLLSRMPSSA